MRAIAWRLLAATGLLAGMTIPAPSARAASLHLLHAEPLSAVRVDENRVSAGEAAGRLLAAGRGRLEFVAYGRQFELELESNDSLLGVETTVRDAAERSRAFLKGSMPGVPGSWARLAAASDGLTGAVWDGTELYVLESAADIAAIRVTPAAGDEGILVYRASDALLMDAVIGCGNVGPVEKTSLAESTKAVLAELQPSSKAGATREIDVALIADAEFVALHGARAEEAMLERLNIADGIFSTQLGLQLVAAELELFPAEPDPFSETRDDALLAELVSHARSQPGLDAMAVSYLFTGREVCGEGLFGCSVNGRSTATLCGGGAAAFGEPLGSAYPEALLLAHELGHNLGAVHDGLAPCKSTPKTGYLMSQFTEKRGETISSCSLTQMSATLSSSSCVRVIPGQTPTEPPPAPPPAPAPRPVSNGSGGGGGHAGFSVLLLAGLAAFSRRRRIAVA